MEDHEIPVVRVLDADRGLASALTEEELALARRFAVAEVVELPPGKHDPVALFSGKGLLGLLVVEGLMICQATVIDRRSGELMGPGSVLRPWDDFGHAAPVPLEVSWHVLKQTRLARLDRRFLATIVRWPGLIEALTARVTERANNQAFNLAIHCLRHVDLRLLALFWHLADRFGKATPAGTHVPLPLSHSDLAELVGVARPSVTIALKQLAETGLAWRNRADATWLLSREPPAELRDMRRRRTALLAA